MAATIVWFRRDLRLDDNPALRRRSRTAWPGGVRLRACAGGGGRLGARRRQPLVAAPRSLQALDARPAPRAARAWWCAGARPLSALQALAPRPAPTRIALEPPLRTGADRRAMPRIKQGAARRRPRGATATTPRCCSSPGRSADRRGRALPGVHPVLARGARRGSIRRRVAAAPARIAGVAGLRVRWRSRTSGCCPGIALGRAACSRPGRPARRARRAARGLPRRRAARTTHGERDRPDRVGTSRLSPHLHFGEISPRRRSRRLLARAVAGRAQPMSSATCASWAGASSRTTCCSTSRRRRTRNLNPQFDALPVGDARRRAARGLAARAHRRADRRRRHARAVAHRLDAQPRAHGGGLASCAKNLRMHWQHGARWFWDTLVDADLRQQHPGLAVDRRQRRRCRAVLPHLQPGDAGASASIRAGDYVRRWVPELARAAGRGAARAVGAAAVARRGRPRAGITRIATDRRPGAVARRGAGRLPAHARALSAARAPR